MRILRDNPVLKNPWLVLGLCLVITVMAVLVVYDFGEEQWRVEIDPSVEPLMPRPSEAREFYKYARQAFGSDDTVVIGIRSDDALSDPTLRVVRDLSMRLESIPGATQVVSFTNAAFPRVLDDAIEDQTISEWAQSRPGDRTWLEWEILKNPLYRNTLLSADGRVTAVIVFFDNLEERNNDEVVDAVYAAVDSSRKHLEALNMEFWVTGSAVITWWTQQAIISSLSIIVPSILGLIAVLLVLAFRSWRGVLLPLVCVSMSLIWLLALMVLSGRSLNLVTAIVPPIVLTLGLAYTVHLISEYYDTTRESLGSAKREVRRVMARIAVPLCVTGFTTAAGFLALTLNPLPAIQEFAVFAAIGVALSVVVCLMVIPSALLLMSRPRAVPDTGLAFFDRHTPVIAAFDMRWRRQILIAGIALFAVSVAAATQIRVGTNYIDDFDSDSRVHRDYEAINQHLGGANPFSIVIRAHVADAFTQPDILEAVSEFQTWLDTQPEIGSSVSLLDHLRVMNQTLNDGSAEYFSVPNSSSAIKQMLIFAAPDNIESYVDSKFSVTHIMARATPDDSAEVGALIERIRDRMAQLPPPLDAEITGSAVLMTQALDEITSGQVRSLSVAFLVVFLILALLFTSLRIGMIAMIPNLLPVAVYYGALGISGVSLNPTTSLIACLVLGIAVDDTVHYLARFNYEARRVASETKATSLALGSVIKPVTFTTVALCLGFLVLTGSELRNHAEFGVLAAFTLAVAWVIDVTFTPALAAGVRIVTLWDYLRVDLGRNPQRAIPLFKDMTLRQARTFALLANIDQFKSGDTIIRQGDKGNEIYVVIEGTASVQVATEGGGKLSVAKLSRGNVFGEIGYFEAGRSATVLADTDIRLLRFNSDDLDHITARRPLLAAKLFRNLSRIQSKRVVSTTKMMTDTLS